jgi:hypothetical protein
MDSRTQVERYVVNLWLQGVSPQARQVCEGLIRKYGLPALCEGGMLIWVHCSPWNKTILRRGDGGDFALEQFLSFDLRADVFDDVHRFNHGIHYNRVSREIGFTSRNEGENFLLANLAQELASKRVSVEQAKLTLIHELELMEKYTPGPYGQGLLDSNETSPQAPAQQQSTLEKIPFAVLSDIVCRPSEAWGAWRKIKK